MSDKNKLQELYLELKNLGGDEYLQLISESKDKDEIEFFIKVMDTILQQRQRSSMNYYD